MVVSFSVGMLTLTVFDVFIMYLEGQTPRRGCHLSSIATDAGHLRSDAEGIAN